MAGFQFGEKVQRQVALLAIADQRHRDLHAGERSLHDGHAFIQHGCQPDTLLFQMAGDSFGAVGTADFFVMPESQVNGAFGLETCFEQMLNSFQDCDELVFDVERSAPPHIAVSDLTGERGVFPFLQGLRVGGNHVLVRRQFLEISEQTHTDSSTSTRQKLLDFVFYASFGVVVTSSVQLAGVLVVFGLLIVPSSCAAIFFGSIGLRIFAGWLIGSIASGIGIAASAFWDLPTGAAVVTALGAVFALAVLSSAFLRDSD